MPELPRQFDRIDSRHRDVTRIEHEVHVLRICVLHDVVDLPPVLELAPHMRVWRKPDAFIADPAPEFLQRVRHVLEVLRRWFPRAAVGPRLIFRCVQPKFLLNRTSLQMILVNLLVLCRILESHLRAARHSRS